MWPVSLPPTVLSKQQISREFMFHLGRRNDNRLQTLLTELVMKCSRKNAHTIHNSQDLPYLAHWHKRGVRVSGRGTLCSYRLKKHCCEALLVDMSRQRFDASAMVFGIEELLEQILSYCPGQTVALCRQVSKPWLALIDRRRKSLPKASFSPLPGAVFV